MPTVEHELTSYAPDVFVCDNACWITVLGLQHEGQQTLVTRRHTNSTTLLCGRTRNLFVIGTCVNGGLQHGVEAADCCNVLKKELLLIQVLHFSEVVWESYVPFHSRLTVGNHAAWPQPTCSSSSSSVTPSSPPPPPCPMFQCQPHNHPSQVSMSQALAGLGTAAWQES